MSRSECPCLVSSQDNVISSLWLKGKLSKEQNFLAHHLFAHRQLYWRHPLLGGDSNLQSFWLFHKQTGEWKDKLPRSPPHQSRETAALWFHFLSAKGRVHKKRQLVIFRLFSLAVYVAKFTSVSNLEQGRFRGQHAELKKYIWVW